MCVCVRVCLLVQRDRMATMITIFVSHSLSCWWNQQTGQQIGLVRWRHWQILHSLRRTIIIYLDKQCYANNGIIASTSTTSADGRFPTVVQLLHQHHDRNVSLVSFRFRPFARGEWHHRRPRKSERAIIMQELHNNAPKLATHWHT